jgi:hypothetical protein
MRNYKLLSWISGIALIFGLFCAAEAMAQPAPMPAPAHHGNSWLSKPIKNSSMLKAVPKDKAKKHAMKEGRPMGKPKFEHPLPPPNHDLKAPDRRFDKKPPIRHADGPNSVPHRKPMGKKPAHERPVRGKKPNP